MIYTIMSYNILRYNILYHALLHIRSMVARLANLGRVYDRSNTWLILLEFVDASETKHEPGF